MKQFILIICCVAFIQCNQKNEVAEKLVDAKVFIPDTLYSKVKFTQLKCGLYINDMSDIALRKFEIIHDSLGDRYLEKYITRVYGKELAPDGGPFLMKNIIDTSTFKILSDYYFKDKRNIYFFTATSDGGTVSLLFGADVKTFKTNQQKSALARDKNNFFIYGEIVDRKSIELNIDSLTWN